MADRPLLAYPDLSSHQINPADRRSHPFVSGREYRLRDNDVERISYSIPIDKLAKIAAAKNIAHIAPRFSYITKPIPYQKGALECVRKLTSKIPEGKIDNAIVQRMRFREDPFFTKRDPNFKRTKKKSPTKPRSDEQKAKSALGLAKVLLKKNRSLGRKRLREVIQKYPGTSAAEQAKKLLK